MRTTFHLLLAVSLTTACTEKEDSPTGGTPGPTGGVTPSQADLSVLTAWCDFLERCAPEIGRIAASESACVEIYTAWLTDELEGNAEPADAAACVSSMQALSCSAMESDGPPAGACERVDDSWFGGPEPLAALGEECSDRGCADGLRCSDDPAGGGACMRCVAPVGQGGDCSVLPCAAGLDCDYMTDTCVAIQGMSCANEWDCGIEFFCGMNSTCEPRTVGSPCAFPPDWCGVDGLECLADQCAGPSDLGGPCDDEYDCLSYWTMFCDAGSCATAAARGQSCTTPGSCLGYLICDGGTCTDLPGLGSSCVEDCLLPYSCENGTCEVAPSGSMGGVANGQLCAESCGQGCTSYLGNCADGYCDTSGSGPWLCTPYLSLGAACTSSEQCDGELAYCDATDHCTALLADGQACGSFEQCQSGLCDGTCDSGPYAGMPCQATWHCGSAPALCVGTCATQDSWPACGN